MNKRQEIMFYWIIGLAICWAIEWFVQLTENIFGFGIISAIFLHVMLNKDMELIK
jgi:hypothetical protein